MKEPVYDEKKDEEKEIEEEEEEIGELYVLQFVNIFLSIVTITAVIEIIWKPAFTADPVSCINFINYKPSTSP